MTTKSISIGDFVDAIEKNGLPQHFGDLFAYGGGKMLEFIEVEGKTQIVKFDDDFPLDEPITMACAFGQGLINSGTIVDNEALAFESLLQKFYHRVWKLNDTERQTIPTIVAKIRTEFAEEIAAGAILKLEEFDYTPYLEK